MSPVPRKGMPATRRRMRSRRRMPSFLWGSCHSLETKKRSSWSSFELIPNVWYLIFVYMIFYRCWIGSPIGFLIFLFYFVISLNVSAGRGKLTSGDLNIAMLVLACSVSRKHWKIWTHGNMSCCFFEGPRAPEVPGRPGRRAGPLKKIWPTRPTWLAGHVGMAGRPLYIL